RYWPESRDLFTCGNLYHLPIFDSCILAAMICLKGIVHTPFLLLVIISLSQFRSVCVNISLYCRVTVYIRG
uniref:Uncharacterized protein n=1 Tax=Oryza brachyantha TaxID=4533 RepID=J3MPR5_ORYBR